jgi:iron-sulfur cluster assembly accessory protein
VKCVWWQVLKYNWLSAIANIGSVVAVNLNVNRSMSLLTITNTARSHFIKMMQRAGAANLTLRMKASGCNGFSYDYTFNQPIQAGATRISVNDVATAHDERLYELFVEAKSIPFLVGTTIDYVRDGLSYKLVYDNPQAKGSCGCGESVNF